jgi:NADH-quinone oxidoreductase subunit N
MSFTYTVSAADWGRIAPELVLTSMVLIVMLVDLLLPRAEKNMKDSGPTNFWLLPSLSLLGLMGAFAATVVLYIAGDGQPAFNQMVGSDQGSLYAYIILLSASALGIMFSPGYLRRINLPHQGEYYALMLLATIGMMLLAAATSFLTVFLGLEMLSLALYILCGFVTRRKSSQEAGMKYFLLSSFASAFLLYGIALIYGATGNTSFRGIEQFLLNQVKFPVGHPIPNPLSFSLHGSPLLLTAMGLLMAGFAFKVSAIPFQAWTPDVYEGAPAPVTGFMSVATKAAAMVAFARVFDVVLFPVRSDWLPVILTITILTVIGGNILALVQSNVKRLLAYSSIAHAGYLLIGIAVGGAVITVKGQLIVGSQVFTTGRLVPGGVFGISAILFYLLSYTFLNLGAFGIVSVLERADNSGTDLNDIRGLWYRQPVLAGLLAFFLLALAGFPPMAGFAAKYYLFYTALLVGHPELLIIGVLASVLGMYYYLRIIAVMFMEKEKESAVPIRSAPQAAIPALAASTSKRAPGRLADTSSTAVATATAQRTGTKAKTGVAVEQAVEKETYIGWMTWTALGIAVAGTLAMGTVLPFWLVDLAQRAALMMLK